MENKTKVLVIDDDNLTRLFLRRVLERMDCVVLDAATAKEGIRLYETDRPDAVFLDIILPDIHGGEVFGMLRSIDKNTRIYIISSSTTEADDLKTKVDAAEFFIKPVEIGLIRAAITALKEGKR